VSAWLQCPKSVCVWAWTMIDTERWLLLVTQVLVQSNLLTNFTSDLAYMKLFHHLWIFHVKISNAQANVVISAKK